MPPPTYTGRPILNDEAVKRSTHFARGLVARTTTDDLPVEEDDSSDKMINILLLVLGLVFIALLAVSMLFLFRRYRQKQRMQNETLPSYRDSAYRNSNGTHNHHGLTIETKHHGRSSTIYISRDGAPMLANPQSPPHSPDNVPEIHITFPDEQDAEGKRKSGRVLVVRVGDNATVGLEPMQEEQLPAYEKESKNGFYSVDMDQIGGLKEKDPDLFK